uniref:Titin n=1 Tax=Paramormyrops kingsleyae TaxID=1676925 RepID=A0A3B3QDV2_9TELE
MNKIGVGELAAIPGTAKPEEKTEGPELSLDSELRKGIVVRAGGSVRINIPFRGRPSPDIGWSKDEAELSDKVLIEKGLNYTQLSIDGCDRNDTGKYTLKLENKSGSVSEFVSVKVLDTPGPPLNLEMKEIKKDSVTLVWEPPVTDGGAKIKNYVVDKRESTRKTYSNVTAKCLKTCFKVENIVEGAMYYFRVMAENEFGVGQPVELKNAVKASEIPLPVGKVTLIDVTKSSVSLAWEKPEHDGGSRITGYLIEMQPKGTDKWGVTTSTKTCDGIVSALTAGQEYSFRVIAYNEKGKSDPTPLAAPVIANDLNIEPSFRLLFNSYNVKSGKDLKIEIPVIGRPKPKIEWMKDGEALKQTTRVTYSSTHVSTILQIKEANKDDLGKYTVTATNSAGSTTEEIGITVLDKPGPPMGPIKIDEVSNNFISISWEPPEYTGGCQVKNYIVEKRDTTTTTWQVVSALVARTAIKITKLKTGSEFQFRVTAENRYGKGPSLDSPSIVVQYPYKLPGPPINDGGGAIIVPFRGRPKPAVSWKKDGLPLRQTSSITLLTSEASSKISFKEATRDHVGKYEITLANTAGTKSVEIGVVVLDKPGSPTALKVDTVTSESITLSWNPPEYDGGCNINNYIVEKRDTITTVWETVSSAVARTSIKVSRLTHGSEYQFRVYAVNRYGKGPFVESSGITAQYQFKLPGPPATPQIAHVTKAFMFVTWNEPVNDGGSPVLGYHLERRERSSVLWIKMNRRLIKDTEFKVTGTEEGLFYEYRVYAENIAGIGKCSKTSELVAARDPCDPPGKPTITNITKTSVSLLWTKPEYDGGAKVTGYIVERRELPQGRWLRCNFTNIQETYLDVTGLTENQGDCGKEKLPSRKKPCEEPDSKRGPTWQRKSKVPCN